MSYGIKLLIVYFVKRVNYEVFTRLDQYKHQEDKNKSDFMKLSKRYHTSLTRTVVTFSLLSDFKKCLIKLESMNNVEGHSNYISLEFTISNKIIDMIENESEKLSEIMTEAYPNDTDFTDVRNDESKKETEIKVSNNCIRQLRKHCRYLKHL